MRCIGTGVWKDLFTGTKQQIVQHGGIHQWMGKMTQSDKSKHNKMPISLVLTRDYMQFPPKTSIETSISIHPSLSVKINSFNGGKNHQLWSSTQLHPFLELFWHLCLPLRLSWKREIYKTSYLFSVNIISFFSIQMNTEVIQTIKESVWNCVVNEKRI